MFALVLFTDNVYCICKKSDVSKGKRDVSIKYKDGKRYAGTVITVKENYEALKRLKTKLEEQSGICGTNDETEKGSTDFSQHSLDSKGKTGTSQAVKNKENSQCFDGKFHDACDKPEATVGASEEMDNNGRKTMNSNKGLKDSKIQTVNKKKRKATDDRSNQATNTDFGISIALKDNDFSDADNDNWQWKNVNLEVFVPQHSFNQDSVKSCVNILSDNETDNSDTYNKTHLDMKKEITALNSPLLNNDKGEVSLNNSLRSLRSTNTSLSLDSELLRDKDNSRVLAKSRIVEVNNNDKETFSDNFEFEDGPFPPDLKLNHILEEENSDHETSSSSLSHSTTSYVPDTSSSNDSINENKNKNVSGASRSQDISKTFDNETSGFDMSTLTCEVGHSAPDNENMFVKTIDSGTKKDFCVYCKTQQAKLSRHLARKHADIKEVESFLDLPKSHEERKKIIAKIRKQGQFLFNTNSEVNTGELKVIRRPNLKCIKTATDYATCKLCKGSYSKSTLRRHFKQCNKPNTLKNRTLMSGSRRIEGRIHSSACKIFRTRVFPTLTDDRVTRAIRYDELLISFANKLCNKYKNPRHFDMIRQKMRQLGRFLLEIKNLNTDIDDLFSVFYPKNYDSCITAIQNLAGLNASGNGFKTPSLATALGTLLKQVGKQCISIWIRRQNKKKQDFAEDFIKLLSEDYSATVARTAIETQFRKRRQSKVALPSVADIEKLKTFLRDRLENARTSLEQKFSQGAYISLAETWLILIQLFNRRRAGEIERTLIEDFLNYEKINEKTIGEAYKKFNEIDKKAASKYVRFTIRGKLGRTVPVLLSTEMLQSLKLLLNNRKSAKISPKNPYNFGISGTLKGDYRYLRACELLRKFSEQCRATNPETLRGTVLRKHIATMCINLNLKDDEVSDLANFMGHADKIHRDHYRQPVLIREILRISKLLEVVHGNENDDESDEDDIEDSNLSQAQSHEGISTSMPSPSQSFADESQSVNGLSSPLADDPSNKKRKRSTSPFGKCTRTRWTKHEKDLILKAFSKHIAAKTLPTLGEIQRLKNANAGLLNRNSATIKTWIHNQYKNALTKKD